MPDELRIVVGKESVPFLVVEQRPKVCMHRSKHPRSKTAIADTFGRKMFEFRSCCDDKRCRAPQRSALRNQQEPRLRRINSGILQGFEPMLSVAARDDGCDCLAHRQVGVPDREQRADHASLATNGAISSSQISSALTATDFDGPRYQGLPHTRPSATQPATFASSTTLNSGIARSDD